MRLRGGDRVDRHETIHEKKNKTKKTEKNKTKEKKTSKMKQETKPRNCRVTTNSVNLRSRSAKCLLGVFSFYEMRRK